LDERVYTATSLAAAAGVSRQAVIKACHKGSKGHLPGAYQVGDRWIIPKADGDRYIEVQKKID
jgi:hypothetical protein